MSVPIFHVDAFTQQAFRGNPAAVCLLVQPATDVWMQAVAAEMNLSETAFVVPISADGTEFQLRWFTPTAEIDLCGHATLATAHILWTQGVTPKYATILFQTRSGQLAVTHEQGLITMDFPARKVEACQATPALRSLLPDNPVFVGKSADNFVIELKSEDLLTRYKADFQAIKAVAPHLLILTCRSDKSEYDFSSRVFAPGVGINEDPVTGSAHCALVTYWGEKLGRNRLSAFQASERGGHLQLEWRGERVFISGYCVTVSQGSLLTV